MDERLNTAPCGFLTFAADGSITEVNQTLLDMLGYGRSDLVGKHVEQILTVGSRIFYQTHWFPLLRVQGGAEEIFLLLRTKSGEQIGSLVNAVRRDREEGTRYDCVIIRVRQRQKYEDELLRARREAEQARAVSEEQREELERANALLEAQALELELQQDQLQEKAEELSATSAELREANADLLERTREAEDLRAEAEEANQAKSTFLAVMSHELRTPLNAIAGYVQILEMGVYGPVTKPQLEALEKIGRSGRHLLRLINEILNLARIEAGHVEYSIEDIPIDEIVNAVTPMIEPQLLSKGVRFSTVIDSQLGVRADREKVQQVLLNLLSNAAKFTPAEGEVRVEAVPDSGREDRVELRVVDTGIGIPPEKLGSIFDPFVQVSTSRTGKEEGTGLGLSISRDLARGMGGELVAESEYGSGSVFRLFLPRARPSANGS